jgi:hypothetical protein
MIMALINILYSTLIIKNNIISKYNKILYNIERKKFNNN